MSWNTGLPAVLRFYSGFVRPLAALCFLLVWAMVAGLGHAAGPGVRVHAGKIPEVAAPKPAWRAGKRGLKRRNNRSPGGIQGVGPAGSCGGIGDFVRIMGEFLKLENSSPVRFAKDFLENCRRGI